MIEPCILKKKKKMFFQLFFHDILMKTELHSNGCVIHFFFIIKLNSYSCCSSFINKERGGFKYLYFLCLYCLSFLELKITCNLKLKYQNKTIM